MRGSVTSLRAVIWYADIRGFTPISDAAPGPVIVDLLNDVFEILTASLRPRGGQVLKFIGDAMLATFSFEEATRAETCRRALDAAIEAMANIDALNTARAAAGVPVASVDLALHIGEVLYGNVGATDRLDFTVIGPAINEVARIEALCEPLGRAVLVSAEFVAAIMGGETRLESLGRHALRGVREPKEIFALDLGATTLPPSSSPTPERVGLCGEPSRAVIPPARRPAQAVDDALALLKIGRIVADAAQAVAPNGEFRRDGEPRLNLRASLLDAAEEGESRRVSENRERGAAVRLHGFPEPRQRFLVLPQHQLCEAEKNVEDIDGGVARTEPHRLGDMRLRLLGAAEGDLDEADLRMRHGEIAVEREGFIELGDRPLRLPRQSEHLTEAIMSHRVVRRETERFQDRRLGRRHAFREVVERIGRRGNRVREHKAGHRIDVVRIDRERAGETVSGIGEIFRPAPSPLNPVEPPEPEVESVGIGRARPCAAPRLT